MPFHSLSDLPDPIKKHLPKHAQEIYMDAFNNAWKEYEDPSKRKKGGSREQVAFSVAWSAVKKQYHKGTDGNWVKGGPI